MNTKAKYPIILLAIALILPLSLANASSYQFNGSAANEVGGTPATITVSLNTPFMLTLQAVLASGDSVNGVDYWFTASTGGVFSITGVDFTGSAFPDPSFSATSSADNFSNSATLGSGHPDGVADNLINPRNGPDLGSSVVTGNPNVTGPSTNQVATYTFNANALGTYTLETFDYAGFGIGSTTTNQAEIFIHVVPEPATWSLLGLGGLGAFGLNILRRRRS